MGVSVMSKSNRRRSGLSTQQPNLNDRAAAVLERAIHPCVESLEGRRLLSVGAANWGPLDASVVKGFTFDYRNGIVVQPDGKVLVAGYVTGSGKDVAVARFTANGLLDNTANSGAN